ncbi:MAG: preprotein translocase subunit YajC [Bacteroidales bacterium]|nr:preprotein translocase subunit YajC [Bacteroidales bacterium]
MNFLNVMLMAGGANGQTSNQGFSGIGSMLLIIIVIFYFFMIRPQTKRQKEEKKFREQLAKGQEVMTVGGMHGKVKEVKERTVMLEIAHDVIIEIEKSSIAMWQLNGNTPAEKR